MLVEYIAHLPLCRCLCHWDRDVPLLSYHGVNVDLDVERTGGVETVTACQSCIDAHCSALLLTRLANDPAPERRERTPWIDELAPKQDPPSAQADGGEGPE